MDYFAFKIYKTYLRINKRLPWLFYYGPLNSAASTAALYPVMLLFSFSVYLGVWSHIDSGVWQFITTLFIAFGYGLLVSYFERKIKKTYPRYLKETRTQCFLGSVFVNIIVVVCISIVVFTCMRYM
jgi:hypothetical protein